jgi:hypothetical protein
LKFGESTSDYNAKQIFKSIAKSLNDTYWSANGEQIMIIVDNSAVFLNAKTGEFIKFNQGMCSNVLHYDYFAQTYWSFTVDENRLECTEGTISSF